MPIRTEIRDRVAEIVIDHPPVNALDSAGWNSLPGLIAEAGRNEAVRCVLIRAEGRGFCGGVDIKEMQAHPERITVLNRGKPLRPSGDSRGWKWRESLQNKRDGSLVFGGEDAVAHVER